MRLPKSKQNFLKNHFLPEKCQKLSLPVPSSATCERSRSALWKRHPECGTSWLSEDTPVDGAHDFAALCFGSVASVNIFTVHCSQLEVQQSWTRHWACCPARVSLLLCSRWEARSALMTTEFLGWVTLFICHLGLAHTLLFMPSLYLSSQFSVLQMFSLFYLKQKNSRCFLQVPKILHFVWLPPLAHALKNHLVLHAHPT